MTSSGRLWVLAVLGILIAVVGVDWLQAQARLATIVIEGQLDPPQVIANGKDTIVLTVHVTENGQPRVNTLLQAWLESGGGYFIPQWVYTDEAGQAQFSYTPNAAGPYDLLEPTVIHLIDINVARLFEVDKHYLVEVPVQASLTTDTK